MTDDDRLALRAGVLESCGASHGLIERLLAYGEAAAVAPPTPADLPLPDEPHIEAWRRYEQEATRDGAVATLRRHFLQLRFPIQAGISDTEAYRRATRRGQIDGGDSVSSGPALRDPEGVALTVHATMGGRVPVITAADREDFVALVQAFTERNEPVPVPDSMGACLVRGLNNWSRIADHRQRWASDGGGADDAAWAAEFKRLVPQKALYQDRLVILSQGGYSAVPAAEAGVDHATWLRESLVIRREHEFTHYFTYRCLGSIRDHALDELVADFVGLLHARGHYDGALARRCLGLEDYPDYRRDGRLENYRATAQLSDEAMAVVRCLVDRAITQLRALSDTLRTSPQNLQAMGQLALALATLSLEELASDRAVGLVSDRLA